HRHLYSFPTRRSSDLETDRVAEPRSPLTVQPFLVNRAASLPCFATERAGVTAPEPVLLYPNCAIGAQPQPSAWGRPPSASPGSRSEEHTSELQSPDHL